MTGGLIIKMLTADLESYEFVMEILEIGRRKCIVTVIPEQI